MKPHAYAEVIIDIEHATLDKPFDYEIPGPWQPIITRGMRVEVPFNHQVRAGVVIQTKASSTVKNIKPIHAIRDIEPYYNDERLELASSLAFRHVRPRMAYLNAMLPSALSLKRDVKYVKRVDDLPETLKPYFEGVSTIDKKTVAHRDLKTFKDAESKGLIKSTLTLKQTARKKTHERITLLKDVPVKGFKQRAIIEYLKSNGPVLKRTLLHETGASNDTLKRLENNKIVHSAQEEQYRHIESVYDDNDKVVDYTNEQRTIIDAVRSSLTQFREHLIHGVTSSGKTEIYIALTKAALARGAVIILIPEIAITPQIVARFKGVFKERVGVYHSALSPGEQYDQWRQALRGEKDILIGARSAIFAPFESIGLIIIDEEQSDAYIQREQAEYDARDVARIRAATHQVPLVYGSATPSVETFYKAKEGRIELHTLKDRALGAKPPRIQRVDMKKEFKSGNASILSQTLKDAIYARLKRGEQTLLLINRRGHANFVLCRDCGKRIICPHCDVSLTYHHYKRVMKCHYCGHEEAAPSRCPACDSKHIRYMGLGSEKAESQVKTLFPSANVMRLDRDTTKKKGSHEALLHQFETTGDILIGTQMIAKGLDFPGVTLVGVLSADMALFVPDFYAESETFSLLSQIAGRSGRRDKQGDVIIQAYDASHDILKAVEDSHYPSFYAREIAFRKAARVEPFNQLALIVVADVSHDAAYHQALKLKRTLNHDSLHVLGPSDARPVKRRDQWRVQLLIRHHGQPSVYPKLSDAVHAFSKGKTHVTLTQYPRIF